MGISSLLPDIDLTVSRKAKFRSKRVNSDLIEVLCEDESYLTKQIITCIGNKRSLLPFITQGIRIAQTRLNKTKLDMFDVFSGSGIVARYFKQFARLLAVNDLEKYSQITNECYLSNRKDLNIPVLKSVYNELLEKIMRKPLNAGIVTELYSPKDDDDVKIGERVFYTRRNAMYIDTARNLIEEIDQEYRKYFLAPLLSEASVHSNTSGVFKSFHKNKAAGIGQFGGNNQDALSRIKGDIMLPFPLFSNFNCDSLVYNGDSNTIVNEAPEVDLAYLDPPYNQHPYGSNYFMLNLILENKYPASVSRISGIPNNWNRSAYNKKQLASKTLSELIANIKAKYTLISFNSEGFISLEEMKKMLLKIGKIEVLKTTYNTFRGCRNLSNRDIHVKEYLYLLEK
ncbi:MAG: DNA adenine methylase [Treponema sp.]|jgi:adenine-specific DNA-methyltransferase|nr:DNA adenine methylase [Treponema sp.]